ncbi:MAG: hypothetical protein IKL44_06950 [Clostridia bacterium]|nr:hypothetical protein [Clostridia bacterium]
MQRKELLTQDIIKSELKRRSVKKLRLLLLQIPIIVISYILLFNIFIMLFDPKTAAKIVFSVACIFVFSAVYIDEMIGSIAGIIKSKNGNFLVEIDWVTGKKPKRSGNGKLNNYRPNTLIFARNGKFFIPEGENNAWSKLYAMDDNSIYHSTDINDDFYIIKIGRKRTAMAYNKKHFELEK